jgi:hypothetical protein
VLCYGGVDVQGEREGGAALLAGDLRLLAGADPFQKRFDFEAQRLALGDGRLGEGEAAEHAGGVGSAVLRLDVDEEQVLPCIVDGDVLMGLEEAELAHALGADAAGGEIRDTTGGELDADVRNIDFARENGKADGLQGVDRRLHQAEDDVEVVHHEVEDDVDVERARSEDAEPVRLEKHGHVDVGMDGEHGGVEALQVAYLEDALMTRRELNQRVRFGERRGDRLFDENIDAGLEQCTGDGCVGAGGDADGGGVELDFAEGTRGDTGVDVGEDVAVGKGGVQRLGAGGIAFDDSGEADGSVGARAQFANDAEMIAAEGACPDDGESDGLSRCGRHEASGRSCLRRPEGSAYRARAGE